MPLIPKPPAAPAIASNIRETLLLTGLRPV
jgi:hypothetical protein